jgi:uncharacterized circularly permuted ATP-grasp superfamily protein/uncharacterized alpha-E superfamily protein
MHDGSPLARGYVPPAHTYDEMVGPDGLPREHWSKLLASLDALGQAERDRRWEKARHILHENGVSYNVYGDPRGMERPWDLSLIPVTISASDWFRIETGLQQRARLLDALLADIYGPQRMLLDGLLPPELVFENPHFLRPCHGIGAPRDRWLPLYGADLVRGPDGGFTVLEDRTQAPTGAGYTLENRIVLSSVLPEAFRDCNVERLAPFFRAFRDTMASLSPHNRDNPRIVLLTPGPYNATYFEQAYLAQYLGYTLVNGGDLTVREDRVYLKTLGGLQPVDVILRRVNDDYCDPLELRPDSLLGVPGLVQAARTGNVAIASPLGTGVLQSPALFPYLSRIARALIGEPLRLPSVRSWWCGDPAAIDEALAQLDDAVVKPAFSEGFVKAVFTAELSPDDRAALATRIRARPRKFVVQERVRASTTPTFEDKKIQPHALLLRGYAVARRDDYVVMPGGLARVAARRDGVEISMQLGAQSKDAWVLSRDPVTNFSLLPPNNRPVELSRGGSDLPSRAADNLYWLGRYAERAEGVARLIRVVSTRLSEQASQSDFARSSEFVHLLRAVTAQTTLLYTAPIVDGASTLDGATKQLVHGVFGEEAVGSLRSVVKATLRAGRLVRDRISTDTWRVLSALGDELEDKDETLALDALGTLHDVLNGVILRLAAFSGQVMESMTRGHAWRFLDMGRRLERAMTLITLLRATLCERSERESTLLEAVLDIADSGMTYRRRYLATMQVSPVVDLLLTDDTNPRSVIYQLEAITRHIAALPLTQGGVTTAQERIALGALYALKLADVERVSGHGEDGKRARLSELLIDLATRVPALSDSLSDRYLAHATVSRHLTLDEGPLTPRLDLLRGGET